MLHNWRPVLGAMLLLAGACGESETAAPPSPSSTAASPTTVPGTRTTPGRTVVPDVVLQDVATGGDVNLRAAAARPGRPTLYWFWAPH